MGTENQQLSAGTAGLAAKYGVAPTMSTNALGDAEDRDLIWDREEGTTSGAGFPGTTTRGKMPVIFKESKAEHHIYNRPDQAEVTELQRRLWAGGFYPPGTQAEDIIPGLPDAHTSKAWTNLLDRSAKYYAAGKQMTVWEVLDEGANILGPGGADRAAGAGGRQPLVTELTNPEDLKYVAQKVAVGALGRGLKPDELNRFISSFHATQQASQAQAYNQAGAAGGTVVGAPSAQAAAETFARQAAPTEAGAHDAVKVFDVMSKLLGGKRGRG